MDQAFDSFKLYLIQNGRREGTINRHLFNLKKLLLKTNNLKNFDKFLLSLKNRGCKNTYLNSFIDTVRVYATHKNLNNNLKHYRFLPEEEFIKATMSSALSENIKS